MKNDEYIDILVAEGSLILRTGLVNTLKMLPGMRVRIMEVTNMEELQFFFSAREADIMLVNPAFGDGYFDLRAFRNRNENTKVLAFVSSFSDSSVLSRYDGSVSIYDTMDTVVSAIKSALEQNEEADDPQTRDTLSQREKEIVVGVVKGMTNKEIADDLFLSVHTVITHRRNISRKLQIHSVSGLTIYAIVNKLVRLEDIKNMI